MNLFRRTGPHVLPERITLGRDFAAPDDHLIPERIKREYCLRRAPVEPIETPLAYVDFNDWTIAKRDLGRYLYLLVMFLRRNGYHVAVGGGPLSICRLQTKFGKLLLERNLVQFLSPRDDKIISHMCVTDGDQPPDRVAHDMHVRLVTGVGPSATGESYEILFPYMLHPTYYNWGYDLILNQWRRESRPVKILFSGNMGPRYSNLEIRERFQKQSRMEVVSTLLQNLDSGQIRFVSTETELPELLARGHGGFVCIDNSQGFRIPKREWLSFLGQTEFQVCPPGVDMPLCHNVVEGMSVGCIPILEYPEYFDPPLRNNSECIVFSGKEELLSAVRRCLSMDEEEVRRLRCGVLRYYETHLRAEAFGRKLAGLQKRDARLGMNFIHDQH